jgi:hypothetical protein
MVNEKLNDSYERVSKVGFTEGYDFVEKEWFNGESSIFLN